MPYSVSAPGRRASRQTLNPEPSYAPDARCAWCGRRGTVGAVARGDGVPVIQARYCFRCWPAARKAAEEAFGREVRASWAAIEAWRRAGATDGDTPPPAPPLGLRAGWRGEVACLLAAAHLVRGPRAPGDGPA